MNALRHAAIAGAVVMLVTGCVGTSSSPETSAPSTSVTTVAPASTPSAPSTSSTTSTTVGVTSGAVETVPCGETDGSLVCEAYELIQRHYVDDIDPAVLADGAAAAVDAVDAPSSSPPEACAIPTDDFVVMCEAIDDGSLDPTTAEEAAVTGMVLAALDPNSAYFDPDALSLIEEEQSGQIEGIGALVSSQEDGEEQANTCQVINDTCNVVIVSTIEGGPARAAGLQPGDAFLRVDGESVEGLSIDLLTTMVRGPAGSDVELTLLRDGEEVTVTITRAAIEVPSLTSQMVDDVAYIALSVFTENADELLHTALESLLTNDPRAIVLDLRNNPGGLLDTSINVTSEFVGAGVVVTTESPESNLTYDIEPGGLATDPALPIYVLVNGGSASASEVVAGALADEERATIIGENTFGKNTVQQRFSLSNGGALKLTIARWLTPAGRDFGGDGITPDIIADLSSYVEASDTVGAVLELTDNFTTTASS